MDFKKKEKEELRKLINAPEEEIQEKTQFKIRLTGEDDDSEGGEELIKNRQQIKLENSLKEDVKKINIKKENIQVPKQTGAKLNVDVESVAARGTYLTWEGSYKERKDEDSRKMRDVKDALSFYQRVKGSSSEGEALRGLIAACNTYCWMKIPFFKFGKAKVRLNEVKQIRERARLELERSPYKDVNLYHKGTKKDEIIPKKIENDDTIQEEDEERKLRAKEPNLLQDDGERVEYGDMVREKATVFRNVVATGGALLAAPFIGLLHSVTLPFRLLGKGINKLFRFVEKKSNGEPSTKEFDDVLGRVTLGNVKNHILMAFNGHPILSKSVKKKEELLRKAGETDAGMYEELDEEEQKKMDLEEDVSFAMEKYPEAKKKLDALRKKDTGKMTPEQKAEHEKELLRSASVVTAYQKNVTDYLDYAKQNGIELDLSRYKDILELDKEKEYQTKLEGLKLRKKITADELERETEAAKQRVESINNLFKSSNDLIDKEMKLSEHSKNRRLKAYAAPMKYLKMDSEEETRERISAVSIDMQTATAEEKTEMARELESTFDMIKEFDLKKLNIKNYEDILEDGYFDNLVMIKLCFEFAARGGLMKDYKELMKDEGVDTRYSEDEYAEVRAKALFLMDLMQCTNSLITEMSKPEHKKYDSFKLLSWSGKKTEKEIETLGTKGMAAQPYIFTLTGSAKNHIVMTGFMPGADMEEEYKGYRNRLKYGPNA